MTRHTQHGVRQPVPVQTLEFITYGDGGVRTSSPRRTSARKGADASATPPVGSTRVHGGPGGEEVGKDAPGCLSQSASHTTAPCASVLRASRGSRLPQKRRSFLSSRLQAATEAFRRRQLTHHKLAHDDNWDSQNVHVPTCAPVDVASGWSTQESPRTCGQETGSSSIPCCPSALSAHHQVPRARPRPPRWLSQLPLR